MPERVGKVVQVIGPVIDIRFEEGSLPNIYNSVEIDMGDKKIIAEVEQHIGDDIVRTISMEPTDGLRRGAAVVDSGNPILVPVGKQVLGRLFNVLGKTIDEAGDFKPEELSPIHRLASYL